jgi:hypothetical protein
MQSAKHKLCVQTGDDFYFSDPGKTHAKNGESETYSARKTHGVKLCRGILELIPKTKITDQFESFKRKKDDMADCFLQGVYWLQDHPPAAKRRKRGRLTREEIGY